MSYLIRTKHNGFSPDGRRTLEKGGGGSSAPYYENMDRLYGAQARAAEYMLNQSMPVLPQYMSNTKRMVTDAMDGTLANQMRQRAGNDATATMGAALDANNRMVQRYGMQFSPDRMLSESNRNAIMGAAQKAGAMSNADLAAEDMKWNRNAGALGQATGMGTGAMQTMGQAASGYGAVGNSMMQNDAMNASGYGKFGAAVAQSAFKDGGEACAPKRRGLRDVRLAAGGDPWSAWKQKNPITMGGPQESGGASALGSAMMGAAPYVIGEGLKAAGVGDGLRAGARAAKDAVKGAFGYAPEAGSTGAGVTGSVGPTFASAEAPLNVGGIGQGLEAGSGAGISAPSGSLAPTLVNAAETGAPSSLVGGTGAGLVEGTGAGLSATTSSLAPTLASAGEAGAMAAGGGTMAALSAAAPWLAGGLALGSALGLIELADGGAVAKGGKGLRRKDFSTKGGEVEGPGNEVSDSIPAMLSDGEFVLNAGAVKMVGKDTLEQVNKAGLRFREDGGVLAENDADADDVTGGGLRRACGGPAKKPRKLAGGGFLGGNLGIALGAGVDEMKDQQRLQQAKEVFDRQKSDWTKGDQEDAAIKAALAMTDPAAKEQAVAAAGLRGQQIALQLAANRLAERQVGNQETQITNQMKYWDGTLQRYKDQIEAEKEIAKIKANGARAASAGSANDGYEPVALTAEGTPVYRQKGKIGFFVDDGKGGATRYMGDVTKLRGVGGVGDGNKQEFRALPGKVAEQLLDINNRARNTKKSLADMGLWFGIGDRERVVNDANAVADSIEVATGRRPVVGEDGSISLSGLSASDAARLRLLEEERRRKQAAQGGSSQSQAGNSGDSEAPIDPKQKQAQIAALGKQLGMNISPTVDVNGKAFLPAGVYDKLMAYKPASGEQWHIHDALVKQIAGRL